MMCKLILAIFQWKNGFSKVQMWVYVGVCALIMVSLAVVFSSEVMGSGKELMNSVLFSANKRVAWYMPFLRFSGPIITFTTGVSGGVFAPALSSGASFGAMVAGWFQLSATNTNLIILAGMVGFLTGVTRTPFTSAILVLEMTNSHNVIFHLMLAGMIASVVALLVDKHSFYDHMRAQYVRKLEQEELDEEAQKLPATG